MRLINLSFLLLLLSACSSMANIDYDRSFDFKSFDSYNIQVKPVRVTEDTRINTPFMQQRIVRAIETSLGKKGFDKTNKKTNLKVKYYLDLKKDFETEESSMSIGFGSSGYHSAIGFGFTVPVGETYSIDKLVLTIDIISTKTKKLVWRGSLAYGLIGGATPDRNTQMVNELVAEIFKDFPPK